MTVAVLDAAAPSARDGEGLERGATRPLRPCAECGEGFVTKQPSQLFCSTAHKRTYNNRWLKRGAVLAPLHAAARMTRGGTRGDKETGRRARRDADHLLQKWKVEDEKANRMSAVDYVARRYRFGLVEVT